MYTLQACGSARDEERFLRSHKLVGPQADDGRALPQRYQMFK